MALFSVNIVSTSYAASTGDFVSTGSTIGFFSDGNTSENEFDTTETLTFTAGRGGATSSAQYVGKVTIMGNEYPVFELLGSLTVIGIGLDSATYPDFSSLGTVDTSNLTVLFCFAEGTEIATPNGARVVEELDIGDLVLTVDGKVVAVKWVGRQTITTLFAGERARLVRIAKGVLGNYSELRVTPDHGMIVDDLVINAGALVDLPGIDLVPLSQTPDRFTVYHVETENHDVILANGAAAETFIDAVSRSRFDNYQDYHDLYGAERIIPEMDRLRISSRRLVPQAIKRQLGIVPDHVHGDIGLIA